MLVTHPYPASGSQFNAMVTDFRRLADGGRPRARAASSVLQDLSQHARARQDAARARRPRRRRGGDRDAGRHDQRARDPHVHRRTPQTADVVRRLGLRDGWSGSARYGFATVGLEALSRVNGWLAFVYPPQFARQVGGITRQTARTSGCRS